MNLDSLSEEGWKTLSLGETETRKFLSQNLGCTQVDLSTWQEGEPVICVVEDRLRFKRVFKRGENKFGPPSFVVYFGANNLSILLRDKMTWRPGCGDTAEMSNKGLAALCTISPSGK